jgi:hypothetical protein
MRNTTYDLFRGTSRENAVLIATVEGLQSAADRMGCLASSEPDDYFLFHAGNIVASVENPKAYRTEIVSAWKIVIISSDSNQLSTLAEFVKKREMEGICIASVGQFREILSKYLVGLVFCDPNLPDGVVLGFQRAECLHRCPPEP